MNRPLLVSGLVLCVGVLSSGALSAAPTVITDTSATGEPAPGAVAIAMAVADVLQLDDFRLGGELDGIFEVSTAPFHAATLPTAECDGDRDFGNIELRQRVEEVQGLLDSLQLNEAQILASTTRAALPCLLDPVDREVLYDLFFIEGVAAFYMGDEAAATASFERAVGVSRRPWNQNFPPSLGQLYVAVKDRLTDLPRSSLRIVSGTPEGNYLVDGGPVEDAVLAPGTHLLQRGRSGDRWTSIVIEIQEESAGGTYPIVDEEGARSMLMGGPLQPDTSIDAAAILGRKARQMGWSELILMTTQSIVALDVEAGTYSIAQPLASALSPSPRAPTQALPSPALPLMVAGSATLVGGVALNLATHRAGLLEGVSPEEWDDLRSANIASAPLMIAGAGTAIGGLVLLLLERNASAQGTSRPTRVVPIMTTGQGGVQFGVTGRLP